MRDLGQDWDLLFARRIWNRLVTGQPDDLDDDKATADTMFDMYPGRRSVVAELKQTESRVPEAHIFHARAVCQTLDTVYNNEWVDEALNLIPRLEKNTS